MICARAEAERLGEPGERPWWARPSSGAALVVLAAVAVFANTLGNGFVYDDLHQVLEDPRIRELGGLPEIFGSGVWSFKWGPSSYYRPMMQLSYLLTYQVAGLAPWAFHLVNVLLHAGASLALYALALQVLAGRRQRAVAGATVAGLIFAVHPLHTEPVAWIAAVGDLQLALWGLLTFLFYLGSLDGRRGTRNAAMVCYALALLSKEPAAAFPLVLLGIDLLWSRQRSLRATALRLAPFVALTLAYLVARRLALGAVAPPGLHGEVDAASAWMTAVYYAGHYVVVCVWPFPLNALYEFRPVLSMADPRLLVSILVCATAVFVIGRLRRDRRVLLAALLFVVPLAPALYVPGLGAGGLAERYVYLPLAGVALAAAIVWTELRRRGRGGRAIAPAALGLLLAAAAAASVSRNTVWEDEETLWADTVRKSPGSAIAHEFLGYGYLAQGKLEQAVAETRRALELDPRRTHAWVNLGAALRAQGRFEEAAGAYRAALDRGSTMLEAHVGLGLALVQLGAYAEGRGRLEIAVAMDPTHAAVYDALGVACANLGDFAAAEAAFAEAVARAPEVPGYGEHLEAARRDRMAGAPAR